MRTVININDAMLGRAMKLTGLKKKVDVVNLALEYLVRQKEIDQIQSLAGRIRWEGDLDEMRRDRFGTG